MSMLQSSAAIIREKVERYFKPVAFPELAYLFRRGVIIILLTFTNLMRLRD